MITRKIKGISLTTVIVVAAMLTGCVTDLDKQEESESSYISFETETRGTKITSGASITTMGVSASIYPAGNTYSSYGNGSYFHNLQVTPGVNTSYYWPASSYNLSFFAYYPYGDSNYRLTSAATATGSPTYTVSVPTAIADQKDFMTGETINRSAGVHTPVPMAFSHQTAAVNMNVTNSRSAAITLTSISINGVKYTGTLTGNAWSLNNSTRNFTLAYGSSIAAGATTAVTGTTNVFMMLPQTIPSGAKVKVVIDGTEEMEADITGTWEAGKNYIYNIDIKNNTIIVINNNTAIENWKDHYQQKYLTFEAIEDGTFSFTQTGLSYSLDDGETWTALAANTATPTIAAGNKILWKGELTASSSYGIGTFSSTGEYKCYGNTMSLIYGDDFREQTILKNTYQFNKLFYNSTLLTDIENLQLPATTLTNGCYRQMFNGCTGLKTSPELPATTLTTNCYQRMFSGCTSLTTAPALPATTLAPSCYYMMFKDCTGLTTAPTLPATTLTVSCYSYMFSYCTSLTTAPVLPATTLANGCYNSMFSGCTSLTTAPALPATTLTSNCYTSMFSGCTSLTTAPELPATILTSGCYRQMFYECTKLNEITCLATDISEYGCLIGWLNYVSSTGTFTKDASMTSWPTGTSGIPSGWTVQDYTP